MLAWSLIHIMPCDLEVSHGVSFLVSIHQSCHGWHKETFWIFRNTFIGFVKEAIYICKEGAQSVNHDEGSNQLSHAYYRFLTLQVLVVSGVASWWACGLVPPWRLRDFFR